MSGKKNQKVVVEMIPTEGASSTKEIVSGLVLPCVVSHPIR